LVVIDGMAGGSAEPQRNCRVFGLPMPWFAARRRRRHFELPSSQTGGPAAPRLAPACRCVEARGEPGQARWVPRLPSARASGRTTAPSHSVLVLQGAPSTHRLEW